MIINMKKKTYLMPVLREISYWADDNFMTSGFGEDATPEEGQWSLND